MLYSAKCCGILLLIHTSHQPEKNHYKLTVQSSMAQICTYIYTSIWVGGCMYALFSSHNLPNIKRKQSVIQYYIILQLHIWFVHCMKISSILISININEFMMTKQYTRVWFYRQPYTHNYVCTRVWTSEINNPLNSTTGYM